MCHTVRMPDRPSIIRPDDVDFCQNPQLYHEASILACIRPDVSAAGLDDVQWSISFIFSFQVQIREDWCNRLDEVDSRPDVLIHKARIAIQKQPSGCTLNRYGNCVLKINRPDGHPPWSGCAKPYMEITCSGRVTVRTTVPYLTDSALKQERFSAKILEILVAQLSVRMAHVHRLDGIRTYHSSRPFEPSAYK
jgi:hypothetical protein